MNNYSPSAKLLTYETLLEEKHYIIYTARGNSMYPFIRQRQDIIEIHQKGSERCKKYDVVLYKRRKMYILHRIIKVRPTDYVIRGDNNYGFEYGITDDQILGVVFRVIRDGKSIYSTSLRNKLFVRLWCILYPIRIAIIYLKNLSSQCIITTRRIFGSNTKSVR